MLGSGGVGALFLFAQQTNSAIALLVHNATTYGDTANARGVPFETAAVEFETRERREGVRSFAFVPNRDRERLRPPAPPPGDFGPGPGGPPGVRVPPPGVRVPPPGTRGAPLAIVDGVVERNVSLRSRFQGSALGFAVAALFGVRSIQPVPFAGGLIAFAPDSQLFQTLALGIAGLVLLAAIVAGVFAAAAGTYITQQAIRPLIEVTEALQRFAARDFRAQPIAVAGRSDFDVLAHAYNAAAAQVAAAFAERDAAEAQMRQFVADAGHELRTPLTIVLGYIDLLRRRAGAGDDRSNFIFASVAAEGRRMRTLVDNLVLLAKLEGDVVRPIEPFDVVALVDEIVSVRHGLHPHVPIAVDARIDGTVVADRGEIHEALANIVDNAIKYAPGSPIAIALDTPRAAAIAISIADDGPGIAAADREAIFERFYRGASRGEVEGSGLGLAIAKRAIERAGGTLALDTNVARGTRFVVTLRAERLERRPAPV